MYSQAAAGFAYYYHDSRQYFREQIMISTYDKHIKEATVKYLPAGYDWRLYKAQLIQESQLDPLAISPVGASGIAQFMPETWKEWAPKAGYPDANAADPEASIFTGAAYMAYLIEFWFVERPLIDRYCLALSSYNAGAGNMLKAQKKSGNAKLYSDIIEGLPKVTGLNSLETINYVRVILANYGDFVTGGTC